MSSSKNGIHIPYRVIFIMVIVSICINIFFLLMGILIGKDDSRWEAAQQNTVEEITEDPPISASFVEDELGQFEQEDRSAPITPLETVVEDKPVQMERDEPRTPPPARQAPTKTVTEESPKPVEPKPKVSKPADPKPKPIQTRPVDPGFYIQVLASKDRSNTSSFLARMKKAGYSADMIHEDGYYKIQVGPYGSRTPANKDKDKINKEFKVNSWVRSR